MKHVFLFITILCSTISSGCSSNFASCHIQNSDEELQEWNLVCKFEKDPSESRRNFQVYHIQQEGLPEVVLDATWHRNSYAVFTADSYYHDGVVTDKVVVRMRKDAVRQGATYGCILHSASLEHVSTCKVPSKQEEKMSAQVAAESLYIRSKGWKFCAHQNLVLVTAVLTLKDNLPKF